MELAHLAQYVFFFAIGILAYYNNWFEQITKKQGYSFVVLFQVSLDKVNFPPTIKFIIVTVLSILTSFGMIYLFRKMKCLFSCGIIKRCKKIIKGRMYDGRKNRKSTRKSFKGI